MNGPDHYAEAERLIIHVADEPQAPADWRLGILADAHVHATLALTAATFDLVWATLPADDAGHSSETVRRWQTVTS